MKSALLSIMRHALKSIESLEHFYLAEYQAIEKKAESGRKKYRLGCVINDFFGMLLYGKKEERGAKWYKELEREVKREISFTVLPEKGLDSRTVRFRYKNKRNLEKKGVELDVEVASEEYMKFVDMPRIHGSNTLIMLITRFEEFIARLIAIVYRQYPQRYLNDQNVCLSDIEGRSFVEIKESVVDRLVSAIMRDKYSKWFALFAEHGLNAHAWAAPLDGLREIYARRNIIVHNAGVVNGEYLEQVPKVKVKKGVRLDVKKEYVDNAFVLVREMVFVLMMEASHFLRKEDVDSYLYAIFEEAFEYLVSRDYSLCLLVYDWLKSAKGLDENKRSMAQVNYWLSKIGEGDCDDETRGEIDKFDVSAKDDTFKLAKYLLLQNYTDATELLDHLLSIGELSSSIIIKWPLFVKYRQTKFFKALVKRHKSMFSDYDISMKRDDKSKMCIKSVNSVGNAHGQSAYGGKCKSVSKAPPRRSTKTTASSTPYSPVPPLRNGTTRSVKAP